MQKVTLRNAVPTPNEEDAGDVVSRRASYYEALQNPRTMQIGERVYPVIPESDVKLLEDDQNPDKHMLKFVGAIMVGTVVGILAVGFAIGALLQGEVQALTTKIAAANPTWNASQVAMAVTAQMTNTVLVILAVSAIVGGLLIWASYKMVMKSEENPRGPWGYVLVGIGTGILAGGVTLAMQQFASLSGINSSTTPPTPAAGTPWNFL